MTCRAAPRDPEGSPPIPRSVDRASSSRDFGAQGAPIEPSGRQSTSRCTSKLNLPQGWSQDYSGSLRSAKSPPLGRWTKSALTLAAPSAATQASASCKTGVTLRLACSVQTIDKRTEARPALPPRRSEAASAAYATIGSRDISDQGGHSAAKRSNRCTSAAALPPPLQKTPTPRHPARITARRALIRRRTESQPFAASNRRRPQVNKKPCAPR